MSTKYMYRDYDALALRNKGERRAAVVQHIKKAQARKQGEEIVFDPKAHKDFVTGFRKRKQQRRKDAIKQLEKHHREQRVEDRKERRSKMKAELGLPEDYGVDSSSSDSELDVDETHLADHKRAEVKVFKQGQTTTTVSVVPLKAESEDSGPEASGSSSSSDEEGQPGQQRQQHKRPRHEQQQREQQQPQHGRKAHKQQVHDREEVVKRQHKQQMLHRLKNKHQASAKGGGGLKAHRGGAKKRSGGRGKR